MSHTYTPSIGPAKGTKITISDRMFDIIENRNTAGGTELQKAIEQAVANNSYNNGDTIELFQNNQLSYEVTNAFINSSWGTKFLADYGPTLQEQIIQKANQHPDIVKDLMENALEEDIENTVELLQFLMEKVNEHPDAVQEIIDILTSLS